jgi:CPA1 family monovalent cation:H+ antiporter
VQREAVWDTVQFSLNGIMFVLLGEQLPGIVERAATAMADTGHLSPWWLLVHALAISAILALLRFAWVWVSLRLSLFKEARQHGEPLKRPDWRLVAVLSLAGVRGAITLAGVLTLPLLLPDGTAFPARDLVIFLAAAVILVSLLAASIGLPGLLRGLEMPDEPAGREEDRARRTAAAAAIAAVEKTVHTLSAGAADADLYTNAAVRVMASYKRRLADSAMPGSVEAERLRQADRAEITLRLAALQAEREAIFRLAREYQISDELSRRLVRQIDLMEARYR